MSYAGGGAAGSAGASVGAASAGGAVPSLEQLEAARKDCVAMDWKVQDMVIIPVAELPSEFLPGPTSGGEH